MSCILEDLFGAHTHAAVSLELCRNIITHLLGWSRDCLSALASVFGQDAHSMQLPEQSRRKVKFCNKAINL